MTLLLLTLFSCLAPPLSRQVAPSDVTDEDGDGYTDVIDCDDGDATVHPDADEACDGIDNGIDDDCDGTVDE